MAELLELEREQMKVNMTCVYKDTITFMYEGDSIS